MNVEDDPQQRGASKMASSMNFDKLDEEETGSARRVEDVFTVHWIDEKSGERLSVAVEVQSHSIVLDVILASVNHLNEKIGKEKKKFNFQLAKDPNLYSLMLADEDLEPEEPGNCISNSLRESPAVQNHKFRRS